MDLCHDGVSAQHQNSPAAEYVLQRHKETADVSGLKGKQSKEPDSKTYVYKEYCVFQSKCVSSNFKCFFISDSGEVHNLPDRDQLGPEFTLKFIFNVFPLPETSPTLFNSILHDAQCIYHPLRLFCLLYVFLLMYTRQQSLNKLFVDALKIFVFRLVCKIAKSDSYLRHVCLSVWPSLRRLPLDRF